MRILLLALVLAAVVPAADLDVSGRWSGTMKMTEPAPRDGTAMLLLKQSGASITGTAGPSEDRQLPISDAKIEGSKFTFHVQAEDVDFTFVMKIEDEHMTGQVTGTQNGQQLKISLDLTHAK
jgi:hypothetical protein